jgi:thiamine-phosphate pyrophosphorylase
MVRSSEVDVIRSAAVVIIPPLYAIIDTAWGGGRSPVEMATALLAAGVRLIQLRDKRLSSREFSATAMDVRQCADKAAGTFIVNDRADIACAVDACGVHLGQEDLPVAAARQILGPGKIVGYSTHVLEQVKEADESTADYVAFGPIFPTSSKAKPDAVVGLAGLAQARKATRKPLVAIGGITLENARAVIAAGADSVAVIRDLLGAMDICKRAQAFIELLASSGKKDQQVVET